MTKHAFAILVAALLSSSTVGTEDQTPICDAAFGACSEECQRPDARRDFARMRDRGDIGTVVNA
jgi:hypothetical protein